MDITSPAFDPGQPIPVKYTPSGEDVSPPLIFSDIPAEAKSLALIMEDPDAPSGTWTHWTVWSIDPRVPGIGSAQKLPGSEEGVTSMGYAGYHGPCPPSGTHRYVFKLFALDKVLNLPGSATADILKGEIEGHELAQAELVGLYSKN